MIIILVVYWTYRYYFNVFRLFLFLFCRKDFNFDFKKGSRNKVRKKGRRIVNKIQKQASFLFQKIKSKKEREIFKKRDRRERTKYFHKQALFMHTKVLLKRRRPTLLNSHFLTIPTFINLLLFKKQKFKNKIHLLEKKMLICLKTLVQQKEWEFDYDTLLHLSSLKEAREFTINFKHYASLYKEIISQNRVNQYLPYILKLPIIRSSARFAFYIPFCKRGT